MKFHHAFNSEKTKRDFSWNKNKCINVVSKKKGALTLMHNYKIECQ